MPAASSIAAAKIVCAAAFAVKKRKRIAPTIRTSRDRAPVDARRDPREDGDGNDEPERDRALRARGRGAVRQERVTAPTPTSSTTPSAPDAKRARARSPRKVPQCAA